jgi:peptide-N4-(N-acetyl-beta-glucosaminyl)asparagine amidase
VGSDELTDQEKRDGGGRVELHRCLDVMCAQVERFVRYNDPLTLLRTRTGRCGA